MSLPVAVLGIALSLPILAGTSLPAVANDVPALASSGADIPDSGRLEKELQALSWSQFKAVVYAVPKLKADVDAFGPLGWQYVQDNYRTYGWRKNIDRLKAPQKKHLAELISQVRSGAVSASHDLPAAGAPIRP